MRDCLRHGDPQGPQFAAKLLSGISIMVHCKGGLGRAGTVASMLLIEKGCASPDILSLSVRVDGVGLSPHYSQAKPEARNAPRLSH